MRTRYATFAVALALLALVGLASTERVEPNVVSEAMTVADDDRFEAEADPEEALEELRQLRLDMEAFDTEMDEIFDGLRRYQELLELEAQGKLWSA